MAGRKSKYEWTKVEAEYVAGVDAPELSAKYAIPLATLESKASREKWGAKRKEVASKLQAELPGKLAGALGDRLAELTQAHFDLWESIINRGKELLELQVPVRDRDGAAVTDPNTGEPMLIPAIADPGNLNKLAAAVKAATEGQRLARGLAAPKEGGDNRGSGAQGSGATGLSDLARAHLEELEQLGAAQLEQDYRAALHSPGPVQA